MPAEDICHPQVLTALKKDGWSITGQQVYILKGDHAIYIDTEAAKEPQQVFIEVKCFPENNTSTEFYIAIGQYLVYRQILSTQKPHHLLYLAIPEDIYDSLTDIHRDTLRDNHVKLMVVNMDMEIVAQWIR